MASTPRPRRAKVSDLRKAFKVLKEEGWQDSRRVVIGSDGTIAIEPMPHEPMTVSTGPKLRLVKEEDIAL